MSNFSNERKPTMWWLILLPTPFVGVLWVPFFKPNILLGSDC